MQTKHRRLSWWALALLCLFAFLPTESHGQFGESGPFFSIGIGPGYSAHADSYRKFELFRIREYTGFRAFYAEGKLGWKFAETTLLYLTGQVSPSNTTISPYRSTYYGISLAKSFYALDPLYFVVGYGKNSAGIESNRIVGQGNLTTIGVGARISQHFYVDCAVMLGKMDDQNYLNPNPFEGRETRFQVLFSYAFFK